MKNKSPLRHTLLCALALLCPFVAQAQVYNIPDMITLRPGCDVDGNGNLINCDPDIEMPFLEYMTVVVASEMSAYWGNFDPIAGGEKEGMHALMAQAVAARSYAIQYEDEHGFVCDNSQACQRYDPAIAAELGITTNPKTFPPLPSNSHYNAYQAVLDTKGFVLTWPEWEAKGGEPAPSYYAASTNSYIGPATTTADANGITCLSSGTPIDGESGGSFGFPCFEDSDEDGNGNIIFPNKGFPRFGHGAGMSQTGALRWAIGKYWNPADPVYKNDVFGYNTNPYASTSNMGDDIPNVVIKDWLQILAHYYVQAYTKQGLTQKYQISITPHMISSTQVENEYELDPDEWRGVDVYIKNGAEVTFPNPFTIGSDHADRISQIIVEQGSKLIGESNITAEYGSDIICDGECVAQAGAQLSGINSGGANSCFIVNNGGTLRFGANSTTTFSDGAFLNAKSGSTIIIEDGASVIFESTASSTDMNIEPGTTFKLGWGSEIVFNVPVSVIGTPTNPVRFEPIDPNYRWTQVHLNADGNYFENVVFEGGWYGAFVTSEDNTFKYTRFKNGMHGIVTDLTPSGGRSDFKLLHSIVEDNEGTGVGVYYADAIVKSTTIRSNGNDGLWIGYGTVTNLYDVLVEDNGALGSFIPDDGIYVGGTGSELVSRYWGRNKIVNNHHNQVNVGYGVSSAMLGIFAWGATEGGYNTIWQSPATYEYIRNYYSQITVQAQITNWDVVGGPDPSNFYGLVDYGWYISTDYTQNAGATESSVPNGIEKGRRPELIFASAFARQDAPQPTVQIQNNTHPIRERMKELREEIQLDFYDAGNERRLRDLYALQQYDDIDSLNEKATNFRLIEDMRIRYEASRQDSRLSEHKRQAMKRAGIAAAILQLMEALNTEQYNDAQSLIDQYAGEVEDNTHQLEMKHAQMTLHQQAGRINEALQLLAELKGELGDEGVKLNLIEEILEKRRTGKPVEKENAPMDRLVIAPEKTDDLSDSFSLEAAYPNPFNPQTTVPFVLSQDSDVQIEVYDVMGRRVSVLANGFHQKGAHSVVFDASNLSSGIYLVRARVMQENGEAIVQTQRLTLMK